MRRGQVAKLGQESLTHWFDVSRVRGVIDGNGPDVDAVTITRRGELLQRCGIAADDGVRGAVDRGDAQRLTPGLQPWLQLSVAEEEGRETASGERPLEQQIAALRQLRSRLHEAVDKLSEEYRSVYLWRDLEDVPAKEVAERLGCGGGGEVAAASRAGKRAECIGRRADSAAGREEGYW